MYESAHFIFPSQRTRRERDVPEEDGRACGITRQSYGAIESGASVPSTEVALRLARELGLGVEDLFQLPEDPRETLDVEVIGSGRPCQGPVRLVRIGGRDLGLSLQGTTGLAVEPADGIGFELPDGRMRVLLFRERPPSCDLLALGCDPSFQFVVRALRQRSGLEASWVRCGSRAALAALAKGHAHVAGIHLVDPETGGYNESWIRQQIPFPCTRIRFVRWQQCLILRAGNPQGVEGVGDLSGGELRFVNRELGSGSRALIEMCLEAEGISGDAIPGYRETAVSGHVAVAEAVAGGLADAGVAIRAAALAFGLDTLPLAEEMYDLVIPDHFLEHPAVEALLMVLRTRALQAQVEALGGYDAEGMGLPL